MGAVSGGLSSIALIGLFYLGQQLLGLPLVPFDIFDWLARVLPGDVVTLGIDSIVNLIDTLNLGSTSGTAKLIEQFLAASLFVVIGIVTGAIIGWISTRSKRKSWQIGAVAGAVIFGVVLLIEQNLEATNLSIGAVIWLLILQLGWGFVVGLAIDAQRQAEEMPEQERAGRRSVLIRVALGTLGLAVGGWAAGRLFGGEDESVGASQPLPTASAAPVAEGTRNASPVSTEVATQVATRDRTPPAPGTREELTSNEDFYRIDINTFPPTIRQDEWTLEVAGLFDNPRNLTLEDLISYPSVTQPITLSCISNRIGGDLIGTSNWTGLRLRDLLEDLGLQRSAQELMLEAADGFYESVTMMDMMDPRTLLVFGMNGQTLPKEHGFPLRIYIPNRYGMKQPKWIVKMTAIDEEGSGYWVERGWSKTAYPKIVSVIDTVAEDEPTQDGRIPVGGIAWAGDRGIQKVEIQIDDGDWQEATLRVPPLSPLTWIQWRYDWDASRGGHHLRVRATDGTGALQIEEETGVRPDGATGYHSLNVNI